MDRAARETWRGLDSACEECAHGGLPVTKRDTGAGSYCLTACPCLKCVPGRTGHVLKG